MKKILAVLVVAVLFAGSAFAGVTTVTKENSQAGYPGVLVPGSMTGTDTFVADLPLLSNIALFEYVGDAYGMTAIKTDMGVFGLSLSPNNSIYVNNIDVYNPGNNLGLLYSTDIEGMTIGAAILYGMNSGSYENKDVENVSKNPDKLTNFDQNLDLKAGVALKGDLALDLAIGINLKNASMEEINKYNDADKRKADEDKGEASKMAIDLAGRLNLGDGLSTVLGITLNSGSYKATEVSYANDVDNTKTSDWAYTGSGSNLAVNALVGKDIKASSSLTIKMASGVNVRTDVRTKEVSEDKIADEKYYTTWTWSELYVDVPVNVAVEGKLNDTWTINSGVSSTILSTENRLSKWTDDNTEESYADRNLSGSMDLDPNVSYAIGVTGVIGDLQLDLNIEPMMLLAGPNFLSGSNNWVTTGEIALLYKW
jgi:hypothetical protein